MNYLKKYQNIIMVLIAVAAVAGLIWLSKTGEREAGKSAAVASANGGVISAKEQNFDFGAISMARGKVSHSFKIKNTGAGPITINKIYTSCMCTNASLIKKGKTMGPFGMPGMGAAVPYINEELAVGEEAEILAVFDPAAHGPAGVGNISREIVVENSGGNFKLTFEANVAP